MNVENEKSKSLWADTEVAAAEPLRSKANADVVVIGSGIAGLSVAYELAERGLKVIVLDRGNIGQGMTARTTAHLAAGCDDGAREFIKMRGEEVHKAVLAKSSVGDRPHRGKLSGRTGSSAISTGSTVIFSPMQKPNNLNWTMS